MRLHRLAPLALVGLWAYLSNLAPCVAQEEPSPELLQMVLTLLADADKDMRAVGLEQVRTGARSAAATRQFAAALSTAPAENQVALLAALADRGDSAARLAIIELWAASKDERVRVAAVQALGSVGDPLDFAVLLPLLSSPSPAEAAAARSSLERLRGAEVTGVVAHYLLVAPPAIRLELVKILAARRGPEGIEGLLLAAVDDDSAVRAAAVAALGALAEPDHIPLMAQAVLRAAKGAERDAAEKALALVAGRIPDANQRAEPLLMFMKTSEPADALALLPALGRIGGPQALEFVELAFADPDSATHALGVRALCNWPDASVAPRLLKMAHADEHAEHRATALAALIRVAPLPDGRPESQKLELLTKVLAMCQKTSDQAQVVKRARAIRTVETLRLLLPYLEQSDLAQPACESIVELAHHRDLREPNKAEFDQALDKVIATSQDAVVIDRAQRYKKGQTWARPTAAQ